MVRLRCGWEWKAAACAAAGVPASNNALDPKFQAKFWLDRDASVMLARGGGEVAEWVMAVLYRNASDIPIRPNARQDAEPGAYQGWFGVIWIN